MPAIAVVFIALPASATDPTIPVRTIETDHFRIHFHVGEEEVARRVAVIAENVNDAVTGWLHYDTTQKTEILVNDDADTANGSANAIPYNAISIFAQAPDSRSVLNDYDDWLYGLILHEYTHVVHMDMVYGIPWLVNKVMGKVTAPNSVQPRWFIEGLATYAESRFTTGGRVRSSLFDMYLRTAMLENAFPPIDVVSSGQVWWPQGTTSYLYGSHFLDFISKRCGYEKLVEITKEYASRLIPYSLNKIARKVCGETYLEMYDEWKAELRRTAELDVVNASSWPLTDYARVTQTAQWTIHPRWIPGGGLAWYAGTMDDYPHIVFMEPGKKPRNATRVNGGGAFSFIPGTRRFVLTQTEIFNQWYVYNDLWLVDGDTGEGRRLTAGLRADSPDVSPEGRRVAFVASHLSRTSLCIASLDDLTPAVQPRMRCPWAPDDQVQISNPKWSPDGKTIAVSAWTPGGFRDIYLVDVASGERRRITADRAVDTEPDFTPDGRYVLFSSDRTGIPNIFACDTAGGGLLQVTNVLTGAFTPRVSSDGTELAFVIYSHDGYDIARMKLEPGKWRTAPAYFDTRGTPRPLKPVKIGEPKRYNPYHMLLLDLWWFPVWGPDGSGETLGIMFGARDIAGQHNYLMNLRYGIGSNAFLYEVSYTMHLFYPYLNFYSSRSDYKLWGVQYINGRDVGFTQWNLLGSVTLSVPFDFWEMSQSVSINYTYEHLNGEYDRSTPFDGPAPRWPRAGDQASIAFSYSMSNARGYTKSISPEEGGSFGAGMRIYSKQLGGAFDAMSFEANARKYVKIPRVPHHVLAFSLSGGTGAGDLGRPTFYLGGVPNRNIIQDLIDNTRQGGINLRGYAPYSIPGDHYVLGNFEWRFPLWYVEKGIGLFPAYFQRLHGAAFFDCGAAWSRNFDADMIRMGTGFEIRADFQLGYYIPASLRIGYAQGLSEYGISQFYAVLGVIY
jgi:hypothetical protein